jgi:cobalt-zinc-cadmium efflux system protein
MSGAHDHGTTAIRHERPLWWAFGLTVTFLVAEVIGAWLTNSLALLSDAAHMATDALALVIALLAVRLSRRPADARRTFGYARFEALGALVNGLLLFCVAGYILWEAVGRIRQPPGVASSGMLVVAAVGLIVNLIAMRLLRAGSGENLNLKGAYLEVWSDMLGSIAVIVAAVVIHFTGWAIVDPILAVAIGLWVLPRTWTLLRDATHVLLNGVPPQVDLETVRGVLSNVGGAEEVHDLHVWSLGSQRISLTAHVVLAEGSDHESVRRQMNRALSAYFGIEHSTLQIETRRCTDPPCDADSHDHHDDEGDGAHR